MVSHAVFRARRRPKETFETQLFFLRKTFLRVDYRGTAVRPDALCLLLVATLSEVSFARRFGTGRVRTIHSKRVPHMQALQVLRDDLRRHDDSGALFGNLSILRIT